MLGFDRSARATLIEASVHSPRSRSDELRFRAASYELLARYVAPRFQGQGVYRSLVGARMALARRLGLSGLATWAKPDTSGPILAWLRFFEVGRLRMHG